MDGGTWVWCSMVWLIFVPALAPDVTFFSNSDNKQARRKLDDVAGSINIDCGLPEGFSNTDDKTGIHYISDAEYIDTGVNVNISLNCISETLQKSLMSVRSFPQGNRNCYTLRPPEGKDGTYLIRATFMYGNYDSQDKLPEFDLYIGVNEWDSIKFDNASHIVIKEIIHVPLMDNIYVCLINTGLGIPFISVLELRHFLDSNYRTQSGSLVLYRRLDVGSTTDQIVRFKNDVYDRMWVPYNCPQSVSINTSFIIDSHNESEYRLPSTVMKTAARPMNAAASLDFNFNTGDPTLDFYVYMHFAELEKLQENQYREFDVALNGKQWKASIVPSYLQSTTTYSNQSVRGSQLNFSMHKTTNSTLPPILNAMEIYIVKDFLQASTNQEDVNAIMDIKSRYGVRKTWQGDPCFPKYPWEGLNCNYSGYDPPRIISLNLTLSGLKGKITPSLSNLKSLEYLDLSNNSLTGAVPDFLSQLPYLRALNLEGNKLSGSIPSVLMERSRNRSLSLSVGGNPNLCLSDPCEKKKKNNVVPLVGAIVSSLVIIIALFIFWSYKRKKAAKLVVKSHKEGSLESNNRQFTYSEMVNITNNFRKVIGKGGFGTVYHGYLSDGVQVAVKMLSSSSAQGFMQFHTEAKLLMRVHHRNLASFVGYCNEGRNIGIIYEYMAFGNLEQNLLDKTRGALSWKERLQIAADAAQGLEYLHHGCKPPIVHRDVKSANILLTAERRAKIADFGISKFFPIESESHLLTSVAGTVGYLDPEYYISSWLTEKSDVYSFGIVLLELITGQPAVIKSNENTHIVQWISPLLARGDIRNIVDPRLQGNYDTNSVWKTLETAMACVPSTSIQRPTMSHVVIELKECLDIEIAREFALRKESQTMRLSNSFDASPVDLETEMGPEAR